MEKEVITVPINSLAQLVELVLNINIRDGNRLYFRGENQDFKEFAFQPSIYRSGFVENEHKIFREAQIYNQTDFSTDNSTFGKITRMQHFGIPTRMIDTSEDLLSALFFSFDGRSAENKNGEKNKESCCLYVLEIDESKIKYYDSDSVSVVANLSKVPLINSGRTRAKSKESISNEAKKALKIGKDYSLDVFNKSPAIEYLLHDIKEDKSYFTANIVPDDIFSMFFVKPQLNSQRISRQKGCALLFGLNKDDVKKSIPLLEKIDGSIRRRADNSFVEYTISDKHTHPILKITKFVIKYDKVDKIREDLSKLGMQKHYIYPELEHVAGHLTEKYKR